MITKEEKMLIDLVCGILNCEDFGAEAVEIRELIDRLSAENERLRKGIKESIAQVRKYPCNDSGHDDRWCSTCAARTDALDEVEDKIDELLKGE